MKENYMDDVKIGVKERMGLAREEVRTRFKNVKPFNKILISDDQILKAYAEMTTEQLNYLLNKHGPEKVEQFILEMDGLRRQRYA